MSSVQLKCGRGIDNIHDNFQLGEKEKETQALVIDVLDTATNVDFDDTSLARPRLGRVRRLAVTAPHSFKKHPHNTSLAYFVAAGVLYKFNSDNTSTAVATLSSNSRMSYTSVNGELVCSNGTDIGWLNGTVYSGFSPTLGTFEVGMPAGQHICFDYGDGSLLVAKGNVIYKSKPYNAEVRDERFSEFPLDGYIRMLAPVEDGWWVATDKHVGFVTRDEADGFRYVHKSDFVPADGCFGYGFTRATEDSKMLVWWASNGFWIGEAGGNLKNLSEQLVRLPSGTSGGCYRRSKNGYYQHIAVIYQDEAGNVFNEDSLDVNTIYQ